MRLCFYLKCLILWLYINGSILTSSTNKWKTLKNFKFIFELMVEKSKNIETNSEAWVLIKVQCVIYQWIRLDKLYKLMERFFFQISNLFLFLNYWLKIKKYSINNKVGFMQARCGRHLCCSARVLVLQVLSMTNEFSSKISPLYKNWVMLLWSICFIQVDNSQ